MWARVVKCRNVSSRALNTRYVTIRNAIQVHIKHIQSHGGVRLCSTSKSGRETVMAPNEISTPMKVLFGYAAIGITAMAVIARWKDGNETEVEELKIYNYARRAVFKDRRVFDLIGYPTEFQKLPSIKSTDGAVQTTTRDHLEGSFRIIGETKDKTLIVHYKALKDQEKSTGLYDFELLDVHPDGEKTQSFSALQAFQETERIDTQIKAASLGNKLFFPIVGGVLLGGVSSFFIIKIIRNRPFYVHKLVLDRVNNHEMARTLLGHSIKANRKQYQGTLTSEQANYSIPCQGSKGKGMIYVKASKKQSSSRSDPTSSSSTTTGSTSRIKPNDAVEVESEWNFSTLTLTVQRNDKRSNDKHAKVINLL